MLVVNLNNDYSYYLVTTLIILLGATQCALDPSGRRLMCPLRPRSFRVPLHTPCLVLMSAAPRNFSSLAPHNAPLVLQGTILYIKGCSRRPPAAKVALKTSDCGHIRGAAYVRFEQKRKNKKRKLTIPQFGF